MKRYAKRLLALVMTAAMVLSMLAVVSFAAEEPVIVAEGTAAFDTDAAAFGGEVVVFTPETNGDITVEFTACDPGYFVEIYEDGEWIQDFYGSEPEANTFAVTAGKEYELMLTSYMIYSEAMMTPAAGSITYQVSFLSNGEVPGGDEEPVDPSLVPGLTEGNPKVMTGSEMTYIAAGQTMYYLYEIQEETKPESMMLHITSGADYAAAYGEQNVPVDEGGFVNYEMLDEAGLGQYRFSVTNNSGAEAFFAIEVRKVLNYVNSGLSLKIGSNNLTLDTSKEFTLYEFSPATTGIYSIRTRAGFVSNWGTAYNPVNNTPEKTQTLTWTCTAVGQSVLVGFSGTRATSVTVIRTGDYVPPVEIPWDIYENTYDFSYEMPEDAVMTDVDLTDGGSHDAFLGSDGFYHYGSVCGPLMVTDLSKVEINLADAYVNGGLRAWILEGEETVSKVDYNEAMNAYYNAGLVPVTEELAMMLQELGIANGWWNEGGFVFVETAPDDLTNAWMQLCGYLEGSHGHQYVDGICNSCGAKDPNAGVTLSGSVASFGEAEEMVTVELILPEQPSQSMMTGDGTFSFENVPAGTYILRFSKKNHVSREYTVTVADTEVTLDAKIHLIGDVTGDGRVNVGDVSRIYAYAKKNGTLDEYELLCADVTGDGRVNVGDTSRVYGHSKKTSALW